LTDKKSTGGQKKFVSLRLKFTAVLIFTVSLCILAGIVLIPVVENLVSGIYMREEYVEQRIENFIGNFSEYVKRENVRSDDVEKVMKWTRRNRYVYLVVFEEGEASFGAMGNDVLGGDAPSDEVYNGLPVVDDLKSDPEIKQCSIHFANGEFTVGIADYTQSAIWWTVVIIGSALLGIIFFTVMLLYYRRQTKYIVALSDEVASVSAGSLEKSITSDRNDEIGELARNVDDMRSTILEKMDEKQKAWQANQELITSMSHDIRTPLTALLGYIELLNSDSDNFTESQKSYLQVCQKKTEQIKSLSDRLLLYFWAYGGDENRVEMEEFNAKMLLMQMVGEHEALLSREGISLDMQKFTVPDSINLRINAECLSRVFDNIFDNVRKYADKEVGAEISADFSDSKLTIALTNRKAKYDVSSAGTHIGLKTCVNMLSMMGGVFDVQNGESDFTVTINLPIHKA
jgi:signal transduction histidine kinase